MILKNFFNWIININRVNIDSRRHDFIGLSGSIFDGVMKHISLVFIHLASFFNLIDHLMQFFFCNWFFRNGLFEHFSHTST